MRSSALPSYQYGDPMKVLEQKQQQAANAGKRAEKRRTLTVKPGWSEARKRAEELFDFAGSGAVSAVLSPALPAMEVDPD